MATASSSVSIAADVAERTPLASLLLGTTSSQLLPRVSMAPETAALAPSPRATTMVTAATPTKTPKMVRPDRNKLPRIAESASRHAVATIARLFMPQRLHRLESRSPARREIAEQHTHGETRQ